MKVFCQLRLANLVFNWFQAPKLPLQLLTPIADVEDSSSNRVDFNSFGTKLDGFVKLLISLDNPNCQNVKNIVYRFF